MSEPNSVKLSFILKLWAVTFDRGPTGKTILTLGFSDGLSDPNL